MENSHASKQSLQQQLDPYRTSRRTGSPTQASSDQISKYDVAGIPLASAPLASATAEGPPRLPRATVTSAPAPDPSEGSRTRPDRGFADPGGGWPVGLGPAPH
jgi:hypothetical protein